MPRLKPIEPAEAQGRAKELFEGPLKAAPLNIFKSMINSPAAVEAYLGMSAALAKGGLSEQEREEIALSISEANQCTYCVAAHSALGKKAGLTDTRVLAARRGHVEGDAKHDALVKFALKLHEKRGWLSDEDLQHFRAAGYTDAHAAEAIAVYAQTIFTNYFNHVNATAVDFPAATPLR